MLRIAAVLFVALLACAGGHELLGPPAPQTELISLVVVTALKEPTEQTVVTDPDSIAAIASSWAFSAHGWSASSERELAPLYKIEFRAPDIPPGVYWLGFNSYPPRFPCYSLCTGVWVAPSARTGEPDLTRYKGLADTVRFRLFQHLKLPSRNALQLTGTQRVSIEVW